MTAFWYRTPEDGLPCFEDWMTHATSIWSLGYEHWREAVEVKPVEAGLENKPLTYHSLEATKGTGRVGILLFSLAWSYLKLKTDLESSAEMMADFQR